LKLLIGYTQNKLRDEDYEHLQLSKITVSFDLESQGVLASLTDLSAYR
jgi:hypothetical protein